MAFDITNYIKSQIRAYNSNIDTQVGSAVHDILIAPLSLVLDKYDTDHQTILSNLSLSNVDEMDEDELDKIGKFYLVDRKEGSKSTGEIFIYLTSPTSIQIPKGTTFTSNGKDFETIRDFYLSKLAIEQNYDYLPYYAAGPIPVMSEEEGEETNLPSGSAFSSGYRMLVTPYKIINHEDFSGGMDTESNAQFYKRITSSLKGSSLASPEAIKSTITAAYPDVTQIDVIGAGSPYMFRDLIEDANAVNKYHEDNYLYVASGLHSGIYDNPNIAYADVFSDTDDSSNVKIPAVSSWTSEFSDTMYKGIYSKDDPTYVETSKTILINDFGTGSDWNETIGYLVTEGGWQVHDSVNKDNKIFQIDEISPTEAGVKLGATKGESETDNYARLSVTLLSSMLEDGYKSLDSNDTASLRDLLDSLAVHTKEENLYNFSPIIHRPLSQHTGIGIECSIKTTDNTENGEMAYVTVLRNANVYAAHDGFGLAWRKQPEYLLRMQANNYLGNTDQLNADLAKFNYDYGVDGTQYLGQIKTHPEFWKYNVFLVDNNILREEVWIGNEQIFDQTNGKNQFLQASKVWIEPNKTYDFRMYIYEAFGVEAWVGEDKSLFDNTNRVINKGSSYPTYLPVSGDKAENAITGQLSVYTDRNHFGIGVSRTRNCEWLVNSLKVWSIIESFPMHLFSIKIDPAKYSNSEASDFNLNYYGFAYDPILIDDTSYDGSTTKHRSKVELAIYNYDTSAWEVLGTNNYDPYKIVRGEESIDLTAINMNYTLGPLSNYLDDGNRVNVVALAANSGPDFLDNKNHTLRSYFISIDNGVSNNAHRGNCTDIYCHDPNNYKEGSAVVQVSGTSLRTGNLSAINGYIQEILEIREYLSQVTIAPTEYVITNVDNGTTYSSTANYEITFASDTYDGMLIEIIYRYWANGEAVEGEIITSDNRYPNADYTVKVSPAVVINIGDLKYSGGIDAAQMKLKLATYINSLDDNTFDKSDLVNLLYDNGATYVDLNMTITIREYDLFMRKTVKTMTDQRYTMPEGSIAKFYTNTKELTGVTKV